MRKLIIISIALFVLTFISLVGYGMFEGTIDYQWNMILIFMLIILGGAVVVGLIFYFVKKKFAKSFFATLLLLSSIMLCISTYHTAMLYLSYQKCLNDYIQTAKNEIKNDEVSIEFFGMFEGVNNNDFEKVDSIASSYGVKLRIVSDCIGILPYELAKMKYEKMTEEYLEERNGKGWREKMKKEIKPYVVNLFE